jgi:hypothetical protein
VVEDGLLGGEALLRDREVGKGSVRRSLGGRSDETDGEGEEERKVLHGRMM